MVALVEAEINAQMCTKKLSNGGPVEGALDGGFNVGF